MAREITAPELALLRSDTQYTKLYLAIFKPNTIYTALLNGVPSSNDRVYQITFDGGSGTLGNVKAGMTLYVGTSAGAYDLGMCVIRKAPIAGTFYVGLTSAIVWADNCYLTIVDDFDLWAKHATIASEVLSMNVDVGYSDQHSAFNPVPVMGPHAVAWLDSAEVDVEFSSEDSWVIGSTISSHAWEAPGSSASSGMATATPTITYDTPGCYSVYCTVTAANGKTTTGVRHVFVYDRDENMPATVFQLSQCIGDHDTGGWMFDMTMEAEASLSEIHDRALVVLFAEDWYGNEKQSIGPIENRENIVCVGRIVGESLRWDRETGQVHFTVQGLHHWLNQVKAFPVSLSFVGAATDWEGMPALTVDRALWHILYWHSTAIETMDFYPTNDTRYAVDCKTIASKIWGQLADIAFSKIFAAPGVDRFGRLFVEIDPQMVPEVDRDFPVVMDLTPDDWQEAIDFQRVIVNDCSLISLNAEEVNSGAASVTRYSLSPGHVPLRHGEPEMLDRFLCASQSQANQMAGLALGWRINQFPDVPVVFAMNNRMIDPFPRQYCSFMVSAEDTPRDVAFDGQLIPRRVAFYYDADAGYFHPEINFEAETFEQLNTNGDVPDVDEIDMEIPPIPDLPDLPDLPILLPGLPGEGTVSGPPKVLAHDVGTLGNNGVGMVYSSDYNHASPTWRTVNAGLTQEQYRSINHVVKCPNGAIYVGRIMGYGDAHDYFLARAPYVGGTFVIIEDQDSIDAQLTTVGPSQGRLGGFGCNKLVSEEVVYILHKESSSNVRVYHGFGATFAYNGVNFAGHATPHSISYGLGSWLITGGKNSSTFHYVKVNPGCTAMLSNDDFPIFKEMENHVRLYTSGRLYIFQHDNDIALSPDNLDDIDNVVYVTGSAVGNNNENQFATDPSGNYMMGVPGDPKKSSDGGYTWTDVSPLPVLVQWCLDYAGGAGTTSRWVFGSSYCYYSEDFGNTIINKQGNLPTLNPLFKLDVIKVLEQ
jgi:hypothetical protein